MRIKAGVHVVPGIAQTLKGQIIIMGRMEVAMEGRREARRQAGHAQLPGVSAPLSVCALSLSLLFQQTSSFSSSGAALWEIQNESDSSFAFLPSSLLSKFSSLYLPARLPCLSVPLPLALLCLPVSVTPSAGLCARLSLSLPPPLPAPLSPLLNHLNHCVLATQPRLSGSSNTPRGDNPESHTHLDASAVTARPQTPSSRPQTPLCDSAS